MSTKVVGFEAIFLRANSVGEKLYKRKNFIDATACKKWKFKYCTWHSGNGKREFKLSCEDIATKVWQKYLSQVRRNSNHKNNKT